MGERSYFWNGTTTGDAAYAPVSAQTTLHGLMWTILFSKGGRDRFVDRGNEGHIEGYLNSLEPASKGGNAVRIDKGAALVDGTFYLNDDTISVSVPLPISNPRIDRIVLRKDWAGQTVRATRVAGTENASPTAPTITQAVGAKWDIPIAQVLITTAGVITLTDERQRANSPLGGFGQMKLIETITLDGSAAEFVFDDIPQTYKSLYMAGTIRASHIIGTTGTIAWARFYFNGVIDETNYNRHRVGLNPTGPAVIAFSDVGQTITLTPLKDISAANYWDNIEFDFLDYTGNNFKTVLGREMAFRRNALTDLKHRQRAEMFLSTDPITSIWLNLDALSGQFLAGSTLSLYGRV